MNVNKVMLLGRLTNDPEIKTTPAGVVVAKFSIATSEKYKDQAGAMQEKTEFHNIVAWAKLADVIGQYCKKGNRVYIEGKLTTRNWEGQDGIKRYATEIVARELVIIDFPPKDDTQGVPAHDTEEEIKVENIPF